jgi:hypothetical protein
MSKLKSAGALFLDAWVPEMSVVTRKPSWMARKGKSTRPPTPSAASPSSSAPAATDGHEESCAMIPLPEPPPAASVDIATSMALVQLADENTALRTQVAEMAVTMARLRREVLVASEGELVALAMTIATRVVGRELENDPALVVAWAREAVESLAAEESVIIAVARDDRDLLPAEAWEAVGVEHRLQTDALLPRGVLEVRTPGGTITTGAAARLAAVGQVLGVGES